MTNPERSCVTRGGGVSAGAWPAPRRRRTVRAQEAAVALQRKLMLERERKPKGYEPTACGPLKVR
jgi:hypothetical protein